MTKSQFIKFIIATTLAIAALFLPFESLGFVDDNTLSPLEIRVVAIFVMAALYWILQPFPIWSTSMLVIVLMILTVSNSSLLPFRVESYRIAESFIMNGVQDVNIGPEVPVTMLTFKSIMATFADPIIMLFLGGFFLAAAA
ncbi:MAG: anion permease, partial [Verrucomicrobia bacterium]|nr:anion permease [Verrucomicrobiota bacterium]